MLNYYWMLRIWLNNNSNNAKNNCSNYVYEDLVNLFTCIPYLRIEDAMNQKYEEPLERVKDGEEILEHDGGAVYSQ